MPEHVHIPELITNFEPVFERMLEANSSMLFSGKFGSGKSYFLNHYFQQAANAAKYCVVYTQPSGYYHAADEDVLGYLKYDILFELLRQSDLEELVGEDVGTFSTLLHMLQEDGVAPVTVLGAAVVLLLFAGPGAAIGPLQLAKLTGLASSGAAMYSKGLQWLEETKRRLNEDDSTRLEEHLKLLSERRNSLFEESAINDLIHKLLQQQSDRDKQTVLIVDDLDRMLPDDCLSFLNLLSVHTIPSNDVHLSRRKNLYGFDRIIICGHLANLEAAIEHKFGPRYDSAGYMAKIFAERILDYDPAQILSTIIRRRFELPLVARLREEDTEPLRFSQTREQLISNGFGPILQAMVACGVINLRDVERLAAEDYEGLWSRSRTEAYQVAGTEADVSAQHTGMPLIRFILLAFGRNTEKARRTFENHASRADLRNILQPNHVAALLHLGTCRTEVIHNFDSPAIEIAELGVSIEIVLQDDAQSHSTKLIAKMSREHANNALLKRGFPRIVVNAINNLNRV